MYTHTKSRIRRPLLILLGLLVFSCLIYGMWLLYDSHVDRSGWVEKDGVRIYRDFHAKPVSGWLELEEGTYCFAEGGIPLTLWQTIDSNTYYFGENGILVTGWLELDGKTHYFDADGVLTSGWLELDGDWFYLPQGVMATGWQDIDGQRYHFAEDGRMSVGLTEVDGQYYFFGQGSASVSAAVQTAAPPGSMVCGVVSLDGLQYRFGEDGVMVTGWYDGEDGRYHYGASGPMDTGLTEVDGKQYYFGEDGLMVTGHVTIGDQQYRFGEDGAMLTGWEQTDSGSRYYLSDGPMALGWTEVDGKQYYFDFLNDGYAHTGWMQREEYWYYFQDDGSAATGPTWIDGKLHYFSPKGISVVLVNAKNPLPSDYEMELVNVTEYHDVDSRCYDALVRMLADCEAAGIEYVFNSAYRTQKEQTEILETRTAEHMEDFDLSYEEAYEKALETVALPGTSEHQLGLAVDLLGDEAIAWFHEHCWDYGFIVRYTEEKENWTGIIDEPWHFRYVGREVALDIQASGLCLEEYLGAEPVKTEE